MEARGRFEPVLLSSLIILLKKTAFRSKKDSV